MTILHAYRRTAVHSVDQPGGPFVFEVNADGHYLCDVTEPDAVDRLLEISEGYRVYGEPLTQALAADAPLSRFVITNEHSTVDLRTLDRAGLLAFIVAEALDYKPHHKSSDDTIRDKIVELLIGD